MSGGGDAAPGPDWPALRRDYEAGARKLADIAAAAGLTSQKLAIIARREGWTPRGAGRPKSEATRATLKRLKALLQQRLGDFETQLARLGAEADAASNERDIRAMNTLVRTLEKVLELERKDRAARAKRRRTSKQFGDAERDELARRLAALHEQWVDQEAQPAPGPDGDDPAAA